MATVGNESLELPNLSGIKKFVAERNEIFDHTQLTNIGTNTHALIDTHLGLVNEHIDWTNATQNFKTTGDVDGNTFELPRTTSTAGQITQEGSRILHTFYPTDQAGGSDNLFIGEDSGNFVMNNIAQPYFGNLNLGVGAETLNDLTTGFNNVGIGSSALTAVNTGDSNVGIGGNAGLVLTSGYSNTLIGRDVAKKLTLGNENVFIGRACGDDNTIGDQNTGIGSWTLRDVASDSNRLIAIGYSAGRDEDQDDRLIIDNRDRGSAAATRTKAIIYGIMDADPDNQILAINGSLEVNQKTKMTLLGGFAIKLTNKTGANSIAGYCVTADDSTNDAVKLVPINVPSCIGVFLDSGVADGSEAWVVISGIADVYYWGTTVRGYLARTGLTADTGEVAGQATAEVVPTSPFSVDKHFCEIGQCIETRTGAGLARTVLHFN